MTEKKRGLHRGLGALLSVPLNTAEKNVTTSSANNAMQQLPIEFLLPGPYQPRQHFEPQALQELAESIRTQGILQPIIVRRVNDQQYEIIAGERRWRAAQLIQLDTVPVIIRDVTPKTATAIALIENIQRADLNPLEEMQALQRLQNEFEMTHQEIAQAVGKSRATVSNLLRLAQLEKPVLDLIMENKIDLGHAKVLLSVQGEMQIQAAKKIVEQQLSVRATEALIKKWQQPSVALTKPSKNSDPHILKFQKQLSDRLGAPVTLQHDITGSGKMIISYHTLDQLEGLLENLSYNPSKYTT